jgi:two-component system chemotaxis response regulator CheB
MDGHKLIVIGTSAGGVKALATLLSALPKLLAASICIAQHFPPTRESALPSILTVREDFPLGTLLMVHGS